MAWVLFGKALGTGTKMGNLWVSLGRGMGKVWEGQGLDGKVRGWMGRVWVELIVFSIIDIHQLDPVTHISSMHVVV